MITTGSLSKFLSFIVTLNPFGGSAGSPQAGSWQAVFSRRVWTTLPYGRDEFRVKILGASPEAFDIDFMN